jgi:hypothetical protein
MLMNPPFEKAADHFAPLTADQQATDRMIAEAIADLRAVRRRFAGSTLLARLG